MPTTQILGFTAANTMEVEAATKAARATLRAEDYMTGGIFSLAANSGIMAAGLAAPSPIWSFCWQSAAQYAQVHRVVLSVANDTVAFTAGIVQFNLFTVRSFTTPDSGGTAIAPSGNLNKLRTSMATSVLTDCRIATTGALTPGQRAIDGDPIASLICGVPAVAGSPMIPPTPFFDQRPGEHPLILAPNEGLVLYSGGIAIAATGTWKFSVKIDWTEKPFIVP